MILCKESTSLQALVFNYTFALFTQEKKTFLISIGCLRGNICKKEISV